MPIPAQVADVALRWRPLSASEADAAYARLEDAWAIVQYRVPGIAARVDSGDLDVRIVISVLCDMVIRVLDPPKRSEQIGNYSYTVGATPDQPGLYLSADEAERLTPVGAQPSAFTIRKVAVPEWSPAVCYPSDIAWWPY